MVKDSSHEKEVEKQPLDEARETPFDPLELMMEGQQKAEAIKEPTEGEHAAMLRQPELYAAAVAKSDAAYQNARQALDRGDERPAQKLIQTNEQKIALTRAVIASIAGKLKEYEDLG